jgi:hypothetical protein
MFLIVFPDSMRLKSLLGKITADPYLIQAISSGFIPTHLITMPSNNSGSICSVAPLISAVEDCNHV